jgi:RNA polymerase sigma factor (sigma-70 family)
MRHPAAASVAIDHLSTDEALMRAYGGGDPAAFEALYARHKAATYRYFLRHLDGDTATAEELHQDLWLRVVDARSRYEVQAKFSTWLYTLARHRLIDHWRARRPALAMGSLDDDGVLEQVEEYVVDSGGRGDDLLQATIDAEDQRRLIAALAEVPLLQRDAFLLHVEGGLSLDQVAGLTSASVETVKSRLRYAYRRLRNALEDLSR